MSSSINSFKAAILKNKGLAHSNRFEVQITSIPGWTGETQSIKFLCESVNFPGKQITTMDYDNLGTKRPIKIPTGFIEDDVTMVFNLTNNYVIKKMFDSWMKKIVNVDSYKLSSDQTTYKKDIKITQLNQADSSVYAIRLKKSYPISINSIDFDAAADSAIQKVSITFTHDGIDYNV
jgi:hypothetical protein